MALRFDQAYRIARLTDLGNPKTWDDRFQDLDLRLHALELYGQKIDDTIAALEAAALARLNDTFTPLVEEAFQRLASVGALFEATSDSEVTIGLGEVSFVLPEGARAGFVLTAFVAVRSVSNPAAGMICEVIDYDRGTGLLTVDAVLTTGSGTFNDWEIRVTASPDLEHSGRTDNPHQTTASQVGAYTAAQTDGAIAAAIAPLVAAIGDLAADIGTINTALAGKASTASVTALSATVDTQIAATKVYADARINPVGWKLERSDANTLLLNPVGAGYIKCGGVLVPIPRGSSAQQIVRSNARYNSLDAQTLPNLTVIYVFATYTGTAEAPILRLECFSGAAHSPDPTLGANLGVESMNSNRAYTLVGMVYPKSSAFPAISDEQCLIRSWMQPDRPALWAKCANTRATSNIDQEFTLDPQLEFLIWAGEKARWHSHVSVNSNGANNTYAKFFVDGIVQSAQNLNTAPPSNSWDQISASGIAAPSEGYHYGRGGFGTSAGTTNAYPTSHYSLEIAR